MNESEERLKKTRRAYRGVLTRRLNALDEEIASGGDSIKSMVKCVRETEVKINEVQQRLEETIDPEELSTIIEEFCEWKQEIEFALERANRVCEPRSSNNNNNEDNDNCIGSSGERNLVRLPKLDLPTFSGDFLQWQMFHDSFFSSVHNRGDISYVNKFNYLRSQLRGKALDVVRGFALNSENYMTAYNLLCERYGKKSLIIRAHIQKLLNLQYVKEGNIDSLTDFINHVEMNVRSLDSLGISGESYSCFLVQIVLQRLPEQMNTEFARYDKFGESNINDVLTFLNNELTVLQSSKVYIHRNNSATKRDRNSDRHSFYSHEKFVRTSADSNTQNDDNSHVPGPVRSSIFQVSHKNKPRCPICSEDHWIEQCSSFIKLSVHERNQEVKAKNLCFNCLKPHMMKFCKSKGTCKTCHKRHHTLLHVENYVPRNVVHESKNNDSSECTSDSTSAVSCNSINSRKFSVMGTALVRINDSSRQFRVLFDGGSQLTFISKRVVNELEVQPHNETDLDISTFGSYNSVTKRYPIVKIHLSNRYDNSKRIEMNCIVENKICNAIQCNDLSEILKDFLISHQNADDVSVETKAVDMIIGCDYMYDILCMNSTQKIGDLYLSDTLFGHIVQGRVELSSSRYSRLNSCNLINLAVISNDLQDSLPLTPNHFILRKTSDDSNDPLPISNRVTLLSSYNRQQTLLYHFCNRFKREYLTSLRLIATGNHRLGREVKVGDLVLLRSDQIKCFNWPLGRITKLLPGPDGIPRVVLVKTRNTILRRAVSSLVPLELDI